MFLGFQMLNSQVTTAQHMERERAYDVVSVLSALRRHLGVCLEEGVMWNALF